MQDEIQLEICRPSGEKSRFDVGPGVYTIGSDDDCNIRLAHASVESRHAILTMRPDAWSVEDLDSASGTFVNKKRVRGRSLLQGGDELGIGPFILVLGTAAGAGTAPARAAEPKPAPHPAPPPEPAREPPLAAAISTARLEQRRTVKQQIHKELVERMDLKRLTASRINEAELRNKATATIRSIVAEVAGRLPPGINPEDLVKEICDEALGLGPVEDLLNDPDITEIMINGPTQVYVEKAGKLILSERTFMNEASVLAIIERIVSPLGRRIDESQPYVDARLPDGSRVNAIIHPLSLSGPCLTIRKFSRTPFTAEDFVRFGSITPAIAEFCRIAVLLRKNIIVSGGTGSGKTSLLNVLSGYLPTTDRIVTIEDAAELRLTQAHVVRLEARPPNIEGRGAVTIRDLVRNALRMRPDRIVVGECRGGEALDMLQAMNTGHDGSLTTVHANSPRNVISRIETMVLMSGMDLPVRAIREQIAAAIDLVVHEARFSDGTRKVTKVTEIVGQEGDQITMQDIFEYVQTGVAPNGQVLGYFRPTGAVPTFIEEIDARGFTINRSMFDPMQARN
jgi:pilus assembly protein CpaF